MKRTTWTTMLLSFAVASVATAEMATVRIGTPPAGAVRAKRGAVPTAYAIGADQAPALDGKLDEAVWAKAPTYKLARSFDGSAAAAQPTELKLCRAGGVLYVGVRAIEPLMGKLSASRRGHDGGVWGDDSIEIFLGTGGDYWHYAVNAVGSAYDGKGKDGGWNAGPGFRAAAGRERSAYVLEIAIPFQPMCGQKVPTDWILNVCRNRQVTGNTQESAWSPLGGGDSHQPDRFGRLFMTDPPADQPGEVVEKESLTIVPTDGGGGVLVFDLSGVPKGAKIVRADLRIFRTANVDGNFDEAMTDIEIVPLFKEVKPRSKVKTSGNPLPARGPWFDRLDATDAVRQWVAGKANGGFYVAACPFLNAEASCLDIAYEGKGGKLPPQVTGVKAEHRNGQTFITWKEVTDPVGRDEIQWGQLKLILDDLDRKQRVRYVVYRGDKPITAANIAQATPIAEVAPCSAWNVNGRSLERGIDWNLANKYYHPHGHWNPFCNASMDGEWGRECPIDRLVIADGGKPLARTTGLYVHTPAGDGKACYAVVTMIDGVQNAGEITAANTAGPVSEKAAEPQPVFQGELAPLPFWNYNEKRLHYVRWVGPPYANTPSQYFNWSVAVPDQKPAGKYALELHLHAWQRSYWRTPYRIERDSIVVLPHDFPVQTWWYGYHENYGTLKSFRAGAVQPYTERRVLWFLDWVMKKWPVDAGRVIATAKVHTAGGAGPGGDGSGCSGALHIAMRHPERFSGVYAGGAKADYADGAKATMMAVWGRPDWQCKTPGGTTVWQENDLPRLVASYTDGTDLPASTYNGRGVPADISRLIGVCLGRGGLVVTDYGEWGSGHLLPISTTGTWPSPMIRMEVRKDRLLPTFSRSAAAQFAAGPPRYPRINQGYRFDGSRVVDTPDRIEVPIWREGRNADANTDVTLTRVQKFKAAPGRTVLWSIGPASGEATVGKDGLVTIPRVAIPSAATKLVVTLK